jgi:hypothetical protein
MRSKVAFLAVILVLAFGEPVHAQSANASLAGRVTDPGKAVIADAIVTLTNIGTNVSYVGRTNETGNYYVSNLPPGTYRMDVEKPGFKTLIKPGIVLYVQQALEIDFELALGPVTESVTVQGGAPLIESERSSVGNVVNEETILNLPLNGRDWTQLAVLEPGVISSSSLQFSVQSSFERGNRGFGAQMSITGGRPQQNSYRIDGINVNDYTNNGPGSVAGGSPGVDAIQEFSVVTANYDAEYGRTSGGVISAVTRSGTNQFHGDVYEFVRNSALDARNFFDPATIAPFERNQFGASAGGPIHKNRTFVFANYEGLRQSLGVTNVNDVPSADARNGIIHNSDGTTSTITVSPLVAPYLPFWPLPNNGLLSPGNTGLFSVNSNQVTSENFGTLRIDHNFSSNDSLDGSYQYDASNLTFPDALGNVLDGSNTGRQFVSIQESHIFSPQLLNVVRIGFNRSTALNAGTLSAINPLAGELSLGALPGQFAPEIEVPGLTEFTGGLGAVSISRFHQNAYQVYDDVTFTRGIHNLKFGFAAEHDQENSIGGSELAGLFKFGSLTNFLTNQPNSLGAQLPPGSTPRDLRQSIFSGYVQDDVKVRPTLTVNLGLRYEMATVPTETADRLSSLRNMTDPAPHLGNPIFSNPTLRNFEPRVGFAWDPFGNGKSTIRGAFGMFDVLPLIYEFLLLEANGAPFSIQGSATNLPPDSFPTAAVDDLTALARLRTVFIQPNPKRNYVMNWNLNLQHEFSSSLAGTVAYVGSHSVHNTLRIDDANIVLPTPTPAGFLWPTPIGSGTTLNPITGRMDYLDWGSSASYDALEVELRKRMSRGFQVQGSYTWGRAIDVGSSAGTASDPFVNSITSLLFFDRAAFRGPADFNISQNLTISYLWVLPTPRSLHGPVEWVAGGWQVSGIIQANTGLPFTPLIGGDPLGENNSDPFDYPNRLSGPGCSSLVNPGNVTNYIKLNCFGLPLASPPIAAQCVPFQPGGAGQPVAAGTCQNLIGNAGRNEVIGPGLLNFDFSLVKNNRIRENLNLQFRVDTFNIFNHSNFAAPIANSTLFDQTGAPVAGAGQINQTSNANREIQFALKLIW